MSDSIFEQFNRMGGSTSSAYAAVNQATRYRFELNGRREDVIVSDRDACCAPAEVIQRKYDAMEKLLREGADA